MAEPLTTHFGPGVARDLARAIANVHPRFDQKAFLRDALDGFAPLALMDRGRHLARALRRHLPAGYPDALRILVASLGPRPEGHAMASFFYLPHTQFVAEFGLDHPEISLDAQHALTQRFTAEFSIRPFLIHHPVTTLARLHQWAADPDVHVRRLVSEGTRPRLPWAPRLPAFQKDPSPTLALLEKLKDDPEDYVRRSVANHLNDIGKDHPELLTRTAARWMKNAPESRRWIIRHALRFAVKQGNPKALAILGCGEPARVTVSRPTLTPARVRIGGTVRISCQLHSTARTTQKIMADFRIHFIKAGGRTSPKVFKGKQLALPAGETAELAKTISLAVQTTRKPRPGTHRVELLLNGRARPFGSFLLAD